MTHKYHDHDSLDAECITPAKLEDIKCVRVLTDQILSPYPNSTHPSAYLPPAADSPIDISPSAPAPFFQSLNIFKALSLFFGPSLKRVTRANFGIWNNTRYQYEVFYS